MAQVARAAKCAVFQSPDSPTTAFTSTPTASAWPCNLIGFGLNGNSNLNGNGDDGIEIDGGMNNQIGGAAAGERNVIGDSAMNGIHISSGSESNVVLGNVVGLEANGTMQAANGLNGITIGGAFANEIGSSQPGAANIIGGNTLYGVHVVGIAAQENVVAGNWFGLGSDGVASAETTQIAGVVIEGAPSNTVGGTQPGDGNFFGRSSLLGGIYFVDAASTGSTVQHNQIGMNIDGSDAGSSGYGVWASEGGDNDVFDNTIRFMAQAGIGVSASVEGIRIGRNSIYDNDGLGIDLNVDGVTGNDGSADSDTGANTLINFPELTGAFTTGRVSGSIDGSAATEYRIDFYESTKLRPDPSRRR